MTAAALVLLALRLTVIVAIAGVAALVRRRAAAAEQHVIWMAALLAALLSPFASSVLPEWRIGPTIASLEGSRPSPSAMPAIELAGESGSEANNPIPSGTATALSPAVGGRQSPTAPRSSNASAIAIALWAFGTLLCLLRLARAHAHARQIVKSARPIVVDGRHADGIAVLESPRVSGPFTYGVWHPSIVIPADAVLWAADRRNAVMTHEAAHALRRDGLALLIAEVASAVYWWHPAVLFAARQAAVACERACDDAVIRDGMRASDYGAQLLAQAQSNCAWGVRPLATTLFWPTHGIAARIAALLDPRIDRRPLARRRMLVVGVLGLGSAGLIAAASPRVSPTVPSPPILDAPTPVAPTRKPTVAQGERGVPTAAPASTPQRQPAVTFAPACAQADARYARTLKVDSSLSFRGAGSTRYADGSLLLVWTGVDCTAWLRVRGPVAVDPSYSAVRVAPGAEFVAHDDGPGGRRDYVVRPDGSASLSINGAPVTLAAEHRDWTAMIILEYVRRTGLDATSRARTILATGGVPAILDEAQKISGKNVRARYLQAAFAGVSPDKRPAFVHDAAALLDSAHVRGEFLLAIPSEWRIDAGVLAAIYAEAGLIEPDEYVERLLRAAPPPRPLPLVLKPLIERMIASLQSIDRRTALGAYYLDLKP